MEPASTIIAKLGGPTKVAAIVDVHRTQIHKWMWSSERGGTGGNIPHKHVPALLAASADMGVALSASDFAPVIAQASSDDGVAA